MYGQKLWECWNQLMRGYLQGGGYKSETHTDGRASEGEDKSTPGLQGTEAGLGLSADMLTGSRNGLEKRLNIFFKR